MSTRVIALEGGVNCRDLGGYKSRDGRTVKWRKLLRSGHLAHLTQSDIDALEKIGVTRIHDLRRPKEQQNMPSQPVRGEFIADYDINAGSLSLFWQLLRNGSLNTETSHKTFIDLYRNSIDAVIRPFNRLLIGLLENSAHTSLFHCSAGKDRTGMASALLLSALDVPRDVVLEDYLLTSEYLDAESMYQLVEEYLMANKIKWEREWLKPLGTVHEDFICGFFSSIEENYGNVRNYLIHGLGVTDMQLASLKEEFLEQ